MLLGKTEEFNSLFLEVSEAYYIRKQTFSVARSCWMEKISLSALSPLLSFPQFFWCLSVCPGPKKHGNCLLTAMLLMEQESLWLIYHEAVVFFKIPQSSLQKLIQQIEPYGVPGFVFFKHVLHIFQWRAQRFFGHSEMVGIHTAILILLRIEIYRILQ